MRGTSKAILNEFLTGLTTASEQRGYEFIPQKIMGRLQTYTLHTPNTIPHKRYFLFIHVSTIETGFWGVSLEWQEGFNILSSKKENLDWAIILLKSPKIGFLLPSNVFEKMKTGFSLSHNNQIKIEEKHLPLSCDFYNWDSFFQLLKL
jgi:hypothetical protein